jgi:hypothetical protein
MKQEHDDIPASLRRALSPRGLPGRWKFFPQDLEEFLRRGAKFAVTQPLRYAVTKPDGPSDTGEPWRDGEGPNRPSQSRNPNLTDSLHDYSVNPFSAPSIHLCI